MNANIKHYPIVPISSLPLKGILHIQWAKKSMSSWEFFVGAQTELSKLPNYPTTHKFYPEGIPITIIIKHDGTSCTASFHGYQKGAGGGKYIYIGSRGNTNQYRGFLMKFGINIGLQVSPKNVALDFRSNNTVYIS